MQRHLTDKQKAKGKVHIENAREFLQSRYVNIANVKKFEKMSSYFDGSLINEAYEELRESKERVARLERKYK